MVGREKVGTCCCIVACSTPGCICRRIFCNDPSSGPTTRTELALNENDCIGLCSKRRAMCQLPDLQSGGTSPPLFPPPFCTFVMMSLCFGCPSHVSAAPWLDHPKITLHPSASTTEPCEHRVAPWLHQRNPVSTRSYFVPLQTPCEHRVTPCHRSPALWESPGLLAWRSGPLPTNQ